MPIARSVFAAVCVAVSVAAGACSPATADPAATVAATIGPPAGAPAPQIILQPVSGSPASLASLSGTSGTVIAFVRSADWCPFCKKQLADLDAIAAPLAAKGWTLIGVSYDDPEILAAFHAEKKLSYGLYSDPGSAAIKAFNLLNADMKPGTRFFGVPHPAIVFVSKDGTVTTVLREEGYRDRPAKEAILAVVGGE